MAKKLTSLILCALMLLTAAVGCEDKPDPIITTTTPETSVPVATTATETDAPEPEPSQYTWLVKPGKFGDDIQPVYTYGEKIVDLGLMVFDEKYLIDFNGDIKYILSEKSEYSNSVCSYCDICHIIDSTNGVIDPDTYESVNHPGHGGYTANYIYDVDTGAICYANYGTYTDASDNVSYAIVAEGKKRHATPEDNMASDYVYDMSGLYGIVINKKLVVPFEYDAYVGFDGEGIAALRKDGKWTYFDVAGRMLFESTYSPSPVQKQMYAKNNTESVPYTSSSGYIALNRDGKWGFADTDGNMVVDHVFEEARPVYCGKAWVKTEDGWGVIEIERPDVITEEEAIQVLYDKINSSGSSYITISDITPNGRGYYGCEGYGFDVKGEGDEWWVRYYFVDYDGTVFNPYYFKS